jgi:hypothetical protein
MTFFRQLSVFAFLLVGLLGSAVAADSTSAGGKLVPVTKSTDAAWLAQAHASYPLDTCTVSGDKLDSGPMGKPKDYVYSEPGKPDRLIRFCCGDCVSDFKKDPAKYLKILDAAPAKAGAKS